MSGIRKYFNFVLKETSISLVDGSVQDKQIDFYTTKNTDNEYILIVDNLKYKNNFKKFEYINNVYKELKLGDSIFYNNVINDYIINTNVFNNEILQVNNNDSIKFVEFSFINTGSRISYDIERSEEITIIRKLISTRNSITKAINSKFDCVSWYNDDVVNDIFSGVEKLNFIKE